jgi:hypothetical protein
LCDGRSLKYLEYCNNLAVKAQVFSFLNGKSKKSGVASIERVKTVIWLCKEITQEGKTMKTNLMLRASCLFVLVATCAILISGCTDNPVNGNEPEVTPASAVVVPINETEPSMESMDIPETIVERESMDALSETNLVKRTLPVCYYERTGEIVFVNKSRRTAYDIYVDGQDLASVRVGGIYKVTLKAGLHEIQFRYQTFPLTPVEQIRVRVCEKVNRVCTIDYPSPYQKIVNHAQEQ